MASPCSPCGRCRLDRSSGRFCRKKGSDLLVTHGLLGGLRRLLCSIGCKTPGRNHGKSEISSKSPAKLPRSSESDALEACRARAAECTQGRAGGALWDACGVRPGTHVGDAPRNAYGARPGARPVRPGARTGLAVEHARNMAWNARGGAAGAAPPRLRAAINAKPAHIRLQPSSGRTPPKAPGRPWWWGRRRRLRSGSRTGERWPCACRSRSSRVPPASSCARPAPARPC